MPAAEWRRQWLVGTAIAVVVATLLDAALLQRKRTYFTGGFLSVDHIKSAGQGVAFIGWSLAIDAAVLGVVVAAILWAAGRLNLRRGTATVAATVAGILPVVVGDVIT